MNKISGLIITYNEAPNIGQVIENFDFCNEIIIVDSFSTDKTIEIAQTCTKVKIIQNKFEDFTTQRNLALSHATNDWVLFLDGDERLTPELKNEIITVINQPNTKDAYYFYRLFFFAKKPIHFSGTQNDKNFRLFKKSKCVYDPNKKVHETLIVNGTIGHLQNKLLHYSVADYESYVKKAKHYGKLKAQEWHAKGKKYNFIKMITKVFFSFFKVYCLKLGFLDGKEGFLLAKVSAISMYQNFFHLKKLEQEST